MENLCNSDLFLLVEKKKKWRRYLRNKRKRNKQKKNTAGFKILVFTVAQMQVKEIKMTS